MKKVWGALAALTLCGVSVSSWSKDNAVQINDCHLSGITTQVKCGKLSVPSNYTKPEGDKLSINFAVLPAIDNSKSKTPLMFLAGGPGQAAVELAGQIRSVFTEIRKTRDIILVDQRGTGKSHPLKCDDSKLVNQYYSMVPEDFNKKEVSTCVDKLRKENDLSQFTSENAIRDFEEVRKALGHEQINIFGGSYGTRAALVYMRLFPESLKSVVLDSVGPIEVPLGLVGQSSARSFEMLLLSCKEDSSCNSAYPNLDKEFQAVTKRLAESTVSLSVSHPRLGTQTQFNLNQGKFVGTLLTSLYNMQMRSMLPLIIHEAYQENYQPLLGVIATGDDAMNLYEGLFFNIVCNEDVPRITPEMIAQDKNNSFAKEKTQMGWQIACPLWPKYTVDSQFSQPVVADIPTLILSGDLDPVTPPSNGEKSAKTLPNSHHIVSKNSAHIVAFNACGVSIVNEFLNTLLPKTVDDSCLAELPKESFMTSLNGSI
jgi:pimeloyl-ACP methyl ester carboxylesterase